MLSGCEFHETPHTESRSFLKGMKLHVRVYRETVYNFESEVSLLSLLKGPAAEATDAPQP